MPGGRTASQRGNEHMKRGGVGSGSGIGVSFTSKTTAGTAHSADSNTFGGKEKKAHVGRMDEEGPTQCATGVGETRGWRDVRVTRPGGTTDK